MDKIFNTENFMVISELYFRLTDQTAYEISNEEVESLIEYVYGNNLPTMSPDQMVG